MAHAFIQRTYTIHAYIQKLAPGAPSLHLFALHSLAADKLQNATPHILQSLPSRLLQAPCMKDAAELVSLSPKP